MKNHAKVVVIGGGVVGASVLYHLTKAGWKDVLLIERAELTSGSTWHAAGGMHTVNGDPNVAKLQQYTIELYKEIERISGQSCGVHITGGIMLAGTRDRLDWLKMAKARGRYLGMELEIISVDEAAKLFPLMDKKHFAGAMYDPIEGHVDPYGVTHAYAKSAQIGGAEIVRKTRVIDLKARPDGSWDVITDQGNVHAEHVVNAAGLWAREVGRMVGIELPILAMEHQYLITGDMAELAGKKEQLHASISRVRSTSPGARRHAHGHLRARRGSVVSGDDRPGISARIFCRTISNASHRASRWASSIFPRLGKAGIRKVVNGPFTFAPDGNPLVGPIKGLKNFWVACGVMAGLQPGRRRRTGVVALDGRRRSRRRHLGHGCRAIRRLDHAGLYQRQGARELFAPLQHPLSERGTHGGAAAAHHADLREARRRSMPCSATTVARASAVVRADGRRGGRRGQFPPIELRIRTSLRNAAPSRDAVGLLEISNYGKFEVSGPGAVEWLSRMMANRGTGRRSNRIDADAE